MQIGLDVIIIVVLAILKLCGLITLDWATIIFVPIIVCTLVAYAILGIIYLVAAIIKAFN